MLVKKTAFIFLFFFLSLSLALSENLPKGAYGYVNSNDNSNACSAVAYRILSGGGGGCPFAVERDAYQQWSTNISGIHDITYCYLTFSGVSNACCGPNPIVGVGTGSFNCAETWASKPTTGAIATVGCGADINISCGSSITNLIIAGTSFVTSLKTPSDGSTYPTGAETDYNNFSIHS